MLKIFPENSLKNSISAERVRPINRAASILVALLLFLFAIDLMGGAFGSLGGSTANSIFYATSNPFIGLFIGLLTTAIIQSSSTSTSMIVAAVASGAINIPEAVPMIMGANIGTTLTSTLVSLGFITSKNAFRKALAAGTVHDFFNILTVLILFPLEYYYGFISQVSQDLALMIAEPSATQGSDSLPGFSPVFPITQVIVGAIDQNLVSILISFVLLFASLKLFSKLISKWLIGDSRDWLKRYVFERPWKSFFWGTAITAGIQSSSVTTSLVVPLVATNKVSLRNAAPFIYGANIGTTITAFIAVLFKSDAAIGIAFAHLLINTIGVLTFLPLPFLRKLPVYLASQFGRLNIKYRLAGFIYIIFTFFLVPFTLIYISNHRYAEEFTGEHQGIHTPAKTVLLQDE